MEQCRAAVTCSTFDHYSRSVHKIGKLRVDPLLLVWLVVRGNFSIDTPPLLLLPRPMTAVAPSSRSYSRKTKRSKDKDRGENDPLSTLYTPLPLSASRFSLSTRIDSSASTLLGCRPLFCPTIQWARVSRIKGRLNGKIVTAAAGSAARGYNLPE